MTKNAVLIIDNRPIREAYFLEAQKVILKIEKFEEKIRIFHTEDQKLFNQWQDLTFRKHRAGHARAQSQYLELARFHNWIVATAHKLSIEMPKAYILMREEQIRWNTGDEDVRREIDQHREQRDSYIRNEMNGRYNESYETDDDDADDSTDGGLDGLDYFLDRIEEVVLDENADFESLRSAHERMKRLTELSEEELERGLSDDEVSFLLFDVSLNWGQKSQDYSLFKRLWKLMSGEQREYFGSVFASVTENSIEELLLEIGLSADFDDISEFASEEELDDAIFNEEYVDQPIRPKKRDPESEATADVRLKSIFRKLMRKLHPDMHAATGEVPSIWVQRIWDLVQKSYSERDVASLERLFKVTLIRMSSFDELSMSELSEAKHWLKQDFKALEKEAAALKNSWAWGFSKKRNYNSLLSKIEKEYDRELRIVLAEIETLQDQHQMLETLASRPPRRRSDDRSQGRKTPKSRRGKRGRYSEREF